MDNNLTKARAYFYEFLAYPLFFHEHGGKFDRWRELFPDLILLACFYH